MLGYKIGSHNLIRVLITIEIPEDAYTNLNRNSVVVRETAMYRCNKAKVLKIEDKYGVEYYTAETKAYRTTYTLGETLFIQDYDMNVEETCAPGIHFFLDKTVAELYNNPDTFRNGHYREWYSNGQMSREGYYYNSKKVGVWSGWHTNGQLQNKHVYDIKGRKHGVFLNCHDNGHPYLEGRFDRGNQIGAWRCWTANGNLIY